jgi:malonyl CoA-acyl carrier protein transacylase
MSIACLFPGQGSQSVGMGADLFDRFPDWTSEADRILGY